MRSTPGTLNCRKANPLDLRNEKAKMVLNSNRRQNNIVNTLVGDLEVVAKSLIKYLRVMVDVKLSSRGPDYTQAKAA